MKVYSHLDHIPSGQASDKITAGCLVLEGGSFRGLYNQGVMDMLMLNDLNFQTVIGVSAGALGGLNYSAGQIGRSARINLTYRHDSLYFGAEAIRKSGSILNLGFLLEDVCEYEPFNAEVFERKDRRFIAVATGLKNGETTYFEKGQCKDIMSAIRASASMPYITPPVLIDGAPYLDGGCSCKIPYKWALEQNYSKIVVVRTRERDFRKKTKQKDSRLPDIYYKKYPEFAKGLKTSSSDYNRQCDEIDRLEKSGRVFVIAPAEKVTVGRVEGDMEKLGLLYEQGMRETEKILGRLKEYLEM